MLRPVVIASCLLLTSCELPFVDGVALEGLADSASVGAAAEGAVGASASASEALSATRLVIAPEVASAVDPSGAFGGGSNSGVTMMIDSSGLIRAGSHLARFEGANILSEGRLIATLQDGVVYRDGITGVGRFQGLLPANSVRLDFGDGISATNVRPMFVDVLKFEDGRYLVKLATGEEAWVVPTGLSLAILSMAKSEQCDSGQGPGILVRKSGEPISFERCDPQDSILLLTTTDGMLPWTQRKSTHIITIDRRFDLPRPPWLPISRGECSQRDRRGAGRIRDAAKSNWIPGNPITARCCVGLKCGTVASGGSTKLRKLRYFPLEWWSRGGSNP
jgi:hypothetical protein